MLAAAVRLRTLDLIDEDDLADIRRDSEEAWERARQRQKGLTGSCRSGVSATGTWVASTSAPLRMP